MSITSSPVSTDWVSLHGSAFTGERALVTGGAGFIGSHIVRALVTLGAQVVVLDDLSGTGGSTSNIDGLGGVTFLHGTILDTSRVDEAVRGCGLVFHQAALGSVPRSVEQPRLYHDVNVTGTLNVLEAARSQGVRRVMFAASSSAYGDAPTLPKVETMAPSPRSPYAANKVACEALMSAYACSYGQGTRAPDAAGLDTVCLRYFNIFGPHQNANSAYAAVIASFARAILSGERPVIYGDGQQSRDFTHVHNAVHANLLAARSTRRLDGAPINVACGRRVTVNELATTLARLLGRPDLLPLHNPERAGDVKHSLADLKRAKDLLGYVPIVDFEPGLSETVEWYAQTMT